ncbi:MAG TPA: amidohydrolase family protein [Candidatus Eisenbacteria bacterium]
MRRIRIDLGTGRNFMLKSRGPADWSVRTIFSAIVVLGLAAMEIGPTGAQSRNSRRGSSVPKVTAQFHDSHFHLTNYVQEGITVPQFLKIMGDRVGRSTLFGIPLQQEWSYRVSGNDAPTYYLDTDAGLYYYSFTDAAIAAAYLALPETDRARFDPMITGFNPTDMYAADHIRRVLMTFPGVFSGIGEFTIHKEFVSSKIEGDVASLTDPALDRILDFAAEVGLVVLIHNDIDQPFPKSGQPPRFLAQFRDLVRRHPGNSIIWAHSGVGRIVQPVEDHVAMLESMLGDPAFRQMSIDLSWDQVAKYVISTPETTKRAADLIEKYPDRFLFGSDTVAPKDNASYFSVYEMYAPLWSLLSESTREKVLKGNYERIFDEGRRRVRAWEKAHVGH